MPVVQASHSNINIGGRAILYEVQGDAIIFQFGDGQYCEVERDFIRDHISSAITFKLPDINDVIRKHSLNQSIITLPRPQAAYSDYQNKKKIGPCFHGTREALLHEMADWLSGMEDTRMYVLSGLAGIGKSTVAYTIAARADEIGLLGASFFFSRDEVDRSNAKMFFTAIAYQLCLYDEIFAQAIGEALLTKRGSAATTQCPNEQLEALILEPLCSIVQSRVRPILIVIDALDECEEEDANSVLAGLRRLVQAMPAFNIILTTRPHLHVNTFLNRQDGHRIFRLQDIEDKVVDGDIRIYLEYSLSLEQVQKRFPRKYWHASDEETDCLVRASGRLFIIASTAVRLILDKFASNPTAQMQKLLRAFAQDSTPFKDLDHFYTVILRSVVPVECDNDGVVARYQAVIGTIIFIQYPLPIPVLVDFVDTDTDGVRVVLENLESVILLGDDDIPRIYHKSFVDYVTDPTRCSDTNLWIDQRLCQTQIAIHCFQIMARHLKYNILGLGDLARFMTNKDGLLNDGITDEQLKEIIPEQLEYACVYWANHLDVADIENVYLMVELERFSNAHLLHWFEVLSLMKKLKYAHHAIRIVLKHLRLTSSDLFQVLSDSLRFISKFYEIIERSALHTYYSALLFTPTDTLLSRRYITEGSHPFCVIDGVPKRWGALVASLSHVQEGHINSQQFSADDTMFASSSTNNRKDGVLKVWDTATGTPLSIIRGSGLTITNDFSTVASFTDNIISLYNMDGTKRDTTFNTQVKIHQIAISSESCRIAAQLLDGTLCLWDSRICELIGSFDEFASHYKDQHLDPNLNNLQFSPNGATFAYVSATTGLIHLRNGIDGHFIAYLDFVSEFRLLAYSADSTRIATVTSLDLKLHSCENGQLVGVVSLCKKMAYYYKCPFALSVNGSLLAATDGEKVKLWRGDGGNPLPLVEVLDLRASAMVFSWDDMLALVTGPAIKIYNIKTHSFIFQMIPNRLFADTSTFSADCTHLAINYSNIVHLLDIQGLEVSRPPGKEQTWNLLHGLALSPDCSRIACGFEDLKIELWEINNLAKQPIPARMNFIPGGFARHKFSPDDSRCAFGSIDGTIKVWGCKSRELLGTFQYRPTLDTKVSLCGVEVSNSMLAAVGNQGIVLWDHRTLEHIHSFMGSFCSPSLFSANGALLAATVTRVPDGESRNPFNLMLPVKITVFDVIAGAKVATFNIFDEVFKFSVHLTSFSPDNSYLVAQSRNGDFLKFELATQVTIEGPISTECLAQLGNFPIWQGIPFWSAYDEHHGQYCVWALLSPRHPPVPVLWIPREHDVRGYVQGRSIIVLCFEDRRLIFLRPRTNSFR